MMYSSRHAWTTYLRRVLVTDSTKSPRVAASVPRHVTTLAGDRPLQFAIAIPMSNPSRAFSSLTEPSSASSTTSSSTATPSNNNLPLVDQLVQDISRASLYNQGHNRDFLSKRRARRNVNWDVDFCRATATSYSQCLQALVENPTCLTMEEKMALLEAPLVEKAFKVLLRCHYTPHDLSQHVRDWERALGAIAVTPLTESLSLRLLEANGKAGNIGRALALLEYRKDQGYKPVHGEFVYAVTAVEAAGWFLRHHRNVFLSDRDQPVIDNPTRWLDAILLNMHARGFALKQRLACRMMDCFASRGRSGKAVHFFYSVHRTPVLEEEEELDEYDGSFSHYQDVAKILVSEETESEIEDDNERSLNQDESVATPPGPQKRQYKIRLKMKAPPPEYKIPTEIAGKLVQGPLYKQQQKQQRRGRKNQSGRQNANQKPQNMMLKLDRESEPDWSLPLTAAFSFADSLAHGACGHAPLELKLVAYNILIKTCVYRGALWRAMYLIDTTMPANGIRPNVRSYNQLLSGLARVGDVTLMRDYYQAMISKGIEPSYYTVQCIVEGLLNLGDVAGAVTVIQDFFNQHSILPPIETQLKVLEHALGLDMVFEAKRHVYFIQQLWKWEPHYKYETADFIYLMKTYQRDPRISKEALQHLFSYFGARLEDADFF